MDTFDTMLGAPEGSAKAAVTLPVNPTPGALDRIPDALRAVAPHMTDADVAVWQQALLPPMRSTGIMTNRRVAMFIGQMAHESIGFVALSENLNYSAERLCQVWPNHFPGNPVAGQLRVDFFAHNPEALANLIYAGRMGNGPVSSGDGWMFRGGGLTGLTGRAMYTALATDIGRSLAEAVAWVRTPAGAAVSACWYWGKHSLNAPADEWNVEAVTRAINGGLIGLQSRETLTNGALLAVGGV